MLGYNPLKICKMLPCGDSFTPTSECLRYLIREGVIIIMRFFFTQASEEIGMACVCMFNVFKVWSLHKQEVKRKD